MTPDVRTEISSCNLDWIEKIPEIKNFNILFKIGMGAFGTVHVASMKNDSSKKLFALKHIISTCFPRRIRNEIECLSLINSDFVISLETFVRHHDQVVLVMPFFQHDTFQHYYKLLTISEIQVYMKSLFLALTAVHGLGFIHRDIKPSNVLFNTTTKALKLIDFGLSQRESINVSVASKQVHPVMLCNHRKCEVCNLCMVKPQQSTPRAGTAGFRAFEVLLKYENQSTALDIWSAGVILLCLLSGKYPFFKPENDMAAIMQYMSVFGSQNCVETARLLGKELFCSEPRPGFKISIICQHMRSTTFEKSNWITAPPAAYELLERCLDLNPLQRITALQAVNHQFLLLNTVSLSYC